MGISDFELRLGNGTNPSDPSPFRGSKATEKLACWGRLLCLPGHHGATTGGCLYVLIFISSCASWLKKQEEGCGGKRLLLSPVLYKSPAGHGHLLRQGINHPNIIESLEGTAVIGVDIARIGPGNDFEMQREVW